MVGVRFEPTTQKNMVLGTDNAICQGYQWGISPFNHLQKVITNSLPKRSLTPHVPPIYFLTFPNIKRQLYHTKPIQMILNSDNYGPFEVVS